MSSLVNLSRQLRDKTNTIANLADASIIAVDCKFISSTSDLSVAVSILNDLDIIQNFSANIVTVGADCFADVIMFSFDTQPDNAIALLKAKDLRCVINLYKYDQHTYTRNQPFLTLNKKVLFADKEDLLKKYSQKDLVKPDGDAEYESRNSLMIPLSVQLINDLEYEVRKIKVNGLFKDVTMKEMILYIAKDVFGFSKISLVEPDNKKKYTNFILPPMLGISSIFNYLQNADGYGVYEQGITFYIHNEILYIYPRYNTSPRAKIISKDSKISTFYIYKLPENVLEGHAGNHVIMLDDLHLLIDINPANLNLADEGIENYGNGLLLQQCDRLFEEYTEPVSLNKFNIKEDNVELVSSQFEGGAFNQVWQPEFVKSYGNKYTHYSTLSASEAEIIQFKWRYAEPGIITPGTKVTYCYDGDNQIYQNRSGMVEAIHYTMIRTIRQSEQLWGFIADVRVRLEQKTVK